MTMRPTSRAVGILAAGTAAAILPAFVGGPAWLAWAAFLALVCAAAAIDAAALPRPASIVVRIDAPRDLPVGDTGSIGVDAHTGSRAPLIGTVRLEVSDHAEPPDDATARLDDGHLRVRFTVRPLQRGSMRLETAWIGIDGPLGVLRRIVALPLDRNIMVVPNVLTSKRAAIRAFDAADAPAGIKVERYEGDGSEFDALREFRAGDDLRALDWKATARHRTLLRRQFRAERDHDVVLAADAGRLMAARIDGVPKLDLALGAVLRLGYVALKTGDRVGFFGFDERPRVATPPRGGMRAYAALQRAAADLGAREVETNFTLGLSTLLHALKRRTLVVVVTDFADTVSAELLLDNLRRLGRRHVVVFVALEDPDLDDLADAVPSGRLALHRAVVAGSLRRDRRVVLERLRRLGVHPIVAAADRLGVEMIDRYLDLKRREVA